MRFLLNGSTLAVALSVTLVTAQPAHTDSSYPKLAAANVRNAPSTAAPIVTVIPQGYPVAISCVTHGRSVNGTDLWDYVPGSGWVSDSLVRTGTDDAVAPLCANATTYDRAAAGTTKAAASADYLKNALQSDGYGVLTEVAVGDPSAGGAAVGDVIFYDWDGGHADGKVDHAAIVTAIRDDGTVLISQHSEDRPERVWNEEPSHTRLTNLRAYLLHITS